MSKPEYPINWRSYDYDAHRPGVEMVNVVRVTFHRGVGTVEDMHRVVTAYYDPNGDLLAEVDPFLDHDRYAP